MKALQKASKFLSDITELQRDVGNSWTEHGSFYKTSRRKDSRKT